MHYKIKAYIPQEDDDETKIYTNLTEALSAQIELEELQPENIYELVGVPEPGEPQQSMIS